MPCTGLSGAEQAGKEQLLKSSVFDMEMSQKLPSW